MCGDSTNPVDVDELMNGEYADLLLTDPPYNVDYEGSDGQKIENDKMEDASFRQFLVQAFQNADTALKNGGGFISGTQIVRAITSGVHVTISDGKSVNA